MAFLISVQTMAADLRGSMKTQDSNSPASRPLEHSANLGMTTDYMFPGFSQTDEAPAIPGVFDPIYDIFCAGVWGFNLEFEDDGTKIQLYFCAGFKPQWRHLDFEFGVISNVYPDGDDFGGCDTAMAFQWTHGSWQRYPFCSNPSFLFLSALESGIPHPGSFAPGDNVISSP